MAKSSKNCFREIEVKSRKNTLKAVKKLNKNIGNSVKANTKFYRRAN